MFSCFSPLDRPRSETETPSHLRIAHGHEIHADVSTWPKRPAGPALGHNSMLQHGSVPSLWTDQTMLARSGATVVLLSPRHIELVLGHAVANASF